jgi:hypothetical protein
MTTIRHNKSRHNKTVVRSIIFGGTILAGLVIWISINHSFLLASTDPTGNITTNTPYLNPNFSNNDTFLKQSGVQTGPSVGRQSTPLQPAPTRATRLRTRGS